VGLVGHGLAEHAGDEHGHHVQALLGVGDPVDGGTRVTESYRVTWIPTWARILDVPTNRARELQEGMRHTLGRLKAAAEARTDVLGRPS
jgi:hypothetical protein